MKPVELLMRFQDEVIVSRIEASFFGSMIIASCPEFNSNTMAPSRCIFSANCPPKLNCVDNVPWEPFCFRLRGIEFLSMRKDG